MANTDFQSVDEYLATKPKDVRSILQRVRRVIRRALPDAEEVISYQIPAYKVHGRAMLYLAGWAEHYSLYPASDRVIAAVGGKLAPYLNKRTLRFSLTEAIPVKLIERIAKLRAQEAAELLAAKAKVKAKKPARKATKRSARSAATRRRT